MLRLPLHVTDTLSFSQQAYVTWPWSPLSAGSALWRQILTSQCDLRTDRVGGYTTDPLTYKYDEDTYGMVKYP